jgi:hypothetical protein
LLYIASTISLSIQSKILLPLILVLRIFQSDFDVIGTGESGVFTINVLFFNSILTFPTLVEKSKLVTLFILRIFLIGEDQNDVGKFVLPQRWSHLQKPLFILLRYESCIRFIE